VVGGGEITPRLNDKLMSDEYNGITKGTLLQGRDSSRLAIALKIPASTGLECCAGVRLLFLYFVCANGQDAGPEDVGAVWGDTVLPKTGMRGSGADTTWIEAPMKLA